MLLPKISIDQDECDELIFRDITPDYSPAEPNGYGGYNIDSNLIVEVSLTLSFGRGQSIEMRKPYKRSDGAWLINANDVMITNKPAEADDCNCNPLDSTDLNRSYMKTFPSGCLTVVYEVFSAPVSGSTKNKSEGVAVNKFVLSCAEEKDFADIAFKTLLPNGVQPASNPVYASKRKEKMDKLILAWAKFKLVNVDQGCDCDCVATRISQIRNLLLSLK